jgi:hypothetical protein
MMPNVINPDSRVAGGPHDGAKIVEQVDLSGDVLELGPEFSSLT